MTLDEIQSLFEYNAWANSRLLGVLDLMPPEKVFEDVKFSFGNIHAMLVHICAAEEIWLQRITGETNIKLTTVKDLPKYDDIKKKMNKLDGYYSKFVSSMTYEKTNSDISLTNVRDGAFTVKVWMIIQHVVNHSTHHRGQIVAAIRQLGGTPPNIDLINFYRLRNKQG